MALVQTRAKADDQGVKHGRRVACTLLMLIVGGCADDEASTPITSRPTVSTTTDAPSSTSTTASATTAPATTVPATTAPATTASTGPATVPGTQVPPVTATVPVPSLVLSAYFVLDEHVAVVHRSVPHTLATSRAALGELLGAPTPDEERIGLVTAVPTGSVVRGITITDGIATVDLSAEFQSGGGSLSMRLRLAQVVFTLTQFPTVTGVVFEIDGVAVDVFGGEGIVLDHPLTRADFEDFTPAIFVESPAPFDAVHRTVRVWGTANVFEATFMVRLTDADGTVVYEHFQMATSGTGTRGSFDFTIDSASATPGVATLRLWEPSAKDGTDTNVVEVEFTLV
jgi:germination protein M